VIGCTTIEPSRTGCLRSMLKVPVYLLQKKRKCQSTKNDSNSYLSKVSIASCFVLFPFSYEKQLSCLSTSVTRMAGRRTNMTTRCKNKG
jgi:hypothetical protein